MRLSLVRAWYGGAQGSLGLMNEPFLASSLAQLRDIDLAVDLMSHLAIKQSLLDLG